MNTLGRTAKKLREKKGISQDALAKKAEVSSDWLKRLETGNLPQIEHNIALLRSLAAALGYSLSAFLREASVIEPDVTALDADPGLRQLVADLGQLTPEERDMVEAIIRALAKRKSA